MNEAQPRIHLVRVGQETPEVKGILADIQDAMGIAWPPANWRAYAMYPGVMRLFWERLKPMTATEAFLRDALRITELAYRDVSRWYTPGRRVRLSLEDASRVEWELDSFEYGNPQVLIQQVVLTRVMQGLSSGRKGKVGPRHLPSRYRWPEIQLVDEQNAPGEVPVLYQEIRRVLGLPLVNSDYQALAKWPGFLKQVWEDVARWRTRSHYGRLERELADMGNVAAQRLSPPVMIARTELLDALGDESELENLRQMVQMFTQLLPGLIINDALSRIAVVGGRQVTAPGTGEEAGPDRLRPAEGRSGQISPPVARAARTAAALVSGMLGVAAVVYGLRSLSKPR